MTDLPVNEKPYLIWTQGGSAANMSLAEAVASLEPELEREEFQWEVRTPGEETSQEGETYDTLKEAVEYALPWAEVWGPAMGLSWAQLAFIAIASGLVLSTGIDVHEMDEYADEDSDVDQDDPTDGSVPFDEELGGLDPDMLDNEEEDANL